MILSVFVALRDIFFGNMRLLLLTEELLLPKPYRTSMLLLFIVMAREMMPTPKPC